MTDNFDFSQHKINLGDTDYPQKHNAAMDALEQLGNDTVQRAQEAAHHAAIAAKRVMTKPEFDTIRQNEIRNLLGAGFKKTDFDSDYEFAQVNGWQNKFKLKANEIVIDGVWHRFDDTMIQLHEAPNGLQNIDLTQPDFADIDAAIAVGGTSLSKSYLRQREIVIAIQEDIAVSAANATSMAYIQNADNHVYSVDGQLRQRVLSFVVERLPVSVPMASKHFAYGDARNAMNALGWTETDITGQWKKGEKFGVALTWIERLNQGAGHPMNPDGAGRVVNITASAWTPWYSGTARKPNTLSDCFTQYLNTPGLTNGPIADTTGYVGTINAGPNHSGRWNSDGKFYDAIYSSHVRDLRLNSWKVPDSELLNSEMNKSITGDVRGFDSVPFTQIVLPSVNSNTSNEFMNFGSGQIPSSLSIGDRAYVVNADGVINELTVASFNIASNVRFNRAFSKDTRPYVVFELSQSPLDTKSVEPTWTDIVGTPESILNEASTLGVNGFYGTWVGSDGEGGYDLTRKVAIPIQEQYSDDAGISWRVGTPTVGIDNKLGNVVKGRVLFFHYRTKAHFTCGSVNSEVPLVGEVFGSGDAFDEVTLISSLINKVPTRRDWLAKDFTIDIQASRLRSKLSSEGNGVRHKELTLSGTGPTAKMLFSLCEVEGFKAVQLTFKEMKYDLNNSTSERVNVPAGNRTYLYGHPYTFYGFNNQQANERPIVFFTEITRDMPPNWMDGIYFDENGDGRSDATNALAAPRMRLWDGNGWGDDNKFQIIDGVSTLQDENGNTVKYGTHVFVTNVPAGKQHD